MCCMGWMYEFVAILSGILTPFLHKLGIHNMYYPDAIVMFVVIPFVHLMNDEDTKIIILQRNWYQGLRHMLGMHTNSAVR